MRVAHSDTFRAMRAGRLVGKKELDEILPAFPGKFCLDEDSARKASPIALRMTWARNAYASVPSRSLRPGCPPSADQVSLCAISIFTTEAQVGAWRTSTFMAT